MPRFRRPCLVCGALAYGSHCEQHKKEINKDRQRAKDTPERLARKKLLYNHAYRQQRKQVLGSATHCAICFKPFQNGDDIDTDHVIPGVSGSPLQASHAYCNRSKGNRPQ